MAILTDRLLTVRDGWLTLDVTWDDTNLRVNTITITPSLPAGKTLHVALRRNDRAGVWRETTFTSTSTVWSELRPFGGGFNTLDQLDGIGFEVTY